MSSFVEAGLSAVGITSNRFQTSITSRFSSLLFDAMVREVHSGQSTPTDHPVEAGSVVSDHVIDRPDELELSGIVSNTPIQILSSIFAQPSVPGGDPRTRAEDFYTEIVRLRKAAEIVTASTRLRDYESMIIASETVARDKDTNEIVDIVVRLREFAVATVEAVEAPEPVEPVHKPRPDLGRQQKQPASVEVEEKSQGLFAGFAGLFGG